MNWRRGMNRAIGRVTGFKLRRVRQHTSNQEVRGSRPPAHRKRGSPQRGRASDRLLAAPVFILSSVRSGSTLLRVLLDSHSQLHAPFEMHVRRLKVQQSTKLVKKAMQEAGLDGKELEHLLWDRVLHRELERSGKRYIVDKTPSNVFLWERIWACWPDARFIFLLRHPWSTAISWHEAKPDKRGLTEATADALRYMNALDTARSELPGLTVRYEDVTADPHSETRRICNFLGVGWEPEMVDYQHKTYTDFKSGLGDWRDKIRSGTVQESRSLPSPDEIPAELRPLCASWGYLEQQESQRSDQLHSALRSK